MHRKRLFQALGSYSLGLRGHSQSLRAFRWHRNPKSYITLQQEKDRYVLQPRTFVRAQGCGLPLTPAAYHKENVYTSTLSRMVLQQLKEAVDKDKDKYKLTPSANEATIHKHLFTADFYRISIPHDRDSAHFVRLSRRTYTYRGV
jgi:hypothetical protein